MAHRSALSRHAALVLLVLVATPVSGTAQTLSSAAGSLGQARQDLETIMRGCFEKGWGTRTAYATMTFGEAVPRSEQFSAYHRQRAGALTTCGLAAEQSMVRYGSAVDDFKARLLVLPDDGQQVRLVAHALDGSAAAMRDLIRTVFPKVVRLEQRLGQFFALLGQVRPSASASPLVFPQDVVDLENDIAQAMRMQTSAAARYLDAMHTLFPSPALRSRLVVTKILDVLSRATVDVMSADEAAQPRAFRQYSEAIIQAQAMAQSEARAPDTQRMPGVVASYVEMTGHFESVLADMRQVVRTMNENRAELTAGERAVVRQESEKLMFRMEAALERIEVLTVRIDGEATECIRKKC